MVKKKFILILALIIFVFDILTKHFVRAFSPNIQVLPFFYLSFVKNTGSAFGLFQGYNLFFIFFTIILLSLFAYYYKKIPEDRVVMVSFGLVLGGAMGNLFDRIFFGYVTDFLAFTFWPAFNIADAAICTGAVILAVYLLIQK
jgi:signal peptidase II